MRGILYTLFLALLAITIVRPITDPDIWWHLNVGRWILAHAELPTTDHWTYFGLGKNWLPYSWSFEVLVAYVYQHYEFEGLISLSIITSLLLTSSLALALKLYSKSWIFSLFLAALTVVGLIEHFALRPQTFTWLLLIYLLAVANKREAFKLKDYLTIALIFVLWANLHITALIGIGLLGAARIRISIAEVVKGSLVAFFATLFTPHMGAEWGIFLANTDHPIVFSSIVELQPANIKQIAVAQLIILSGLMLVLTSEGRNKANPFSLCVSIILIATGLYISKFLPIALIYLCFEIAKLYPLENEKLSGFFLYLNDALNRRWFERTATLVLLALISLKFISLWQRPVVREMFPFVQAELINARKLKGPILNNFADGGFLSFMLSDQNGTPSQLVALDGRTNLIPPEIWLKYQATERGRVTWREFVETLNPTTVVWRTESPFVALALESKEYDEISRTGEGINKFSLLVKRQ